MLSTSDINELVRIPFLNKGRDFNGVDCWGMAMMVHNLYGINLPEFGMDCFNWVDVNTLIHGEKEKISKWQQVKTPVEPCIVTIKNYDKNPRVVNHVGTYIGSGYFIHTLRKTGALKSRLDNPAFAYKIDGFYVYTEDNCQ